MICYYGIIHHREEYINIRSPAGERMLVMRVTQMEGCSAHGRGALLAPPGRPRGEDSRVARSARPTKYAMSGARLPRARKPERCRAWTGCGKPTALSPLPWGTGRGLPVPRCLRRCRSSRCCGRVPGTREAIYFSFAQYSRITRFIRSPRSILRLQI